jgi:hypothetical protein
MNEFRGRLFEMAWASRSVAAFFNFISTSMPQDAPGSLAPEQYAAVTAYILRLNNRPAGNAELPANATQLETMRWSD